MENLVRNLLMSALFECCHPKTINLILSDSIFSDVVCQSCDDLTVFSKKDPAARFDPNIVATHYSSYKAVLHYRLSHALLVLSGTGDNKALADCARIVSTRGKLLSGAEIHHYSSIGNRFILDHGIGTVIGETCKIGDDCYVLGGVTIGATGIAGNPSIKRHPTIGDRVEVGAFARLYGNITIGDDVFIGPHCLIKDDLPSNSIVTLRSENQVMRKKRDLVNQQNYETV
jgi:serine O-acetyltransferase